MNDNNNVKTKKHGVLLDNYSDHFVPQLLAIFS